MSLIVIGFFVLVVLPPFLMGSAHLYAIKAQDKGSWYVVTLDPHVHSVEKVIADQGVKVTKKWDTTHAKGYSAFMAVKRAEQLKHDRRVTKIEPRDSEQ